MDLPAVQLLCLEQLGHSLEDHTRDFLDLACLTHFPDRSLCVFYYTSLSERCKARLPANGPKEEFAAFVEWVLVNCGSHFTIGTAEEEFTSVTPCDTMGILMEIEGLEGSPAHTPATEGELQLASGHNYYEELMDIFQLDLIDWFGRFQFKLSFIVISLHVGHTVERNVMPHRTTVLHK